MDEDTTPAVEEDTTDDVVHTPASDESTTDENTIDAVDEDTTAENTIDAVAEDTTDEDTIDGETIISGSSNDDTIELDVNATIDGAEGHDALLATEEMNIDMSSLSESVSNIESINLSEGNQHITSISFEDVISITDVDNLLRIDGDSSDTIDLNTQGPDAEWTLGDFKTDAETGQVYQEVTAGEGDFTVTLEISTDIDINEN